MQLRDYQRDAVNRILDSLNDGKHPVCSAPTGSGKTVLLAELCNRLEGRILVVTHRKELIEQNHSTIQTFGHDAGVYSAGLSSRDTDARVIVGGVASIYRRMDELQRSGPFRYVLIDECHVGLSDPSGNMMGDQVLRACPSARRVGLSATPYRMPDLPVWGPSLWFTNLASHHGILELTEQGFLARLVGVQTAAAPDLSHVRTRGGDFALGDLSQASSEASVVSSAIDEILYLAQDRRHVLIFCVDVAHAGVVAEAMRERGEGPEIVTGTTPSEERAEILARFKSGALRWLISVNTLTTGMDAPVTDCVVLMRATMSKSLCLDSETEILTSRGWMRMGQIQVGDCVPAMNLDTYKGEWASVISTVERDMSQDEYWVGYDAPRASFRVTDGHTMIFKKKPNRRGANSFKDVEDDPWLTGKASDMCKIKDIVYMPTAVEIEMPGVPLSDHELYFIGMVLTDGTITNGSISISQSERHPEIITRIKDCLDKCGFKYYARKRPIYRSDENSFPQRYDRWIFTISVGSRLKKDNSSPNNVHKRDYGQFRTKGEFYDGIGCGYLLPYLDKNFPTLLFSMNKRQFLVLLKAIDDGDGYKVAKCPSVDWTPKGWTICSFRQEFVDRLQALAVIHGFTAHLTWHFPERKNPMAKMTFTPKSWRSIKGDGGKDQVRPRMYAKPSTNEKVWCIETTSGTIITRRKGKVTVMGNCVQMMGRGSRLHPEKVNCAILDLGGNIARHAPVDGIPKPMRSPRLAEVQAEAERRAHVKRERERQAKHDAMVQVGLDPLGDGALATEIIHIERCSYALRPASKYPERQNLLVSYKGRTAGGRSRSVTQFVLLQYGGRAKQEAMGWFLRRGMMMPPEPRRALASAWNAPVPETIVVQREGAWDKVIMERFVDDGTNV